MLYGERSLCIQEHGQVDQEVPNMADVQAGEEPCHREQQLNQVISCRGASKSRLYRQETAHADGLN